MVCHSMHCSKCFIYVNFSEGVLLVVTPLLPGLGRSPGEGISHPLQYSWASLVAQLVKNPPAMRETWVQSQGWVDPLGEGKGDPLQSLCPDSPESLHSLENSMDCIVQGVAKSRTRMRDFHSSPLLPALFKIHF